ncbi:MAG: alpha/beta hydrolase [Sporichthyaceae bacterium]|nr:alpha/beta hydrolase [Sporichthyaceae bacterium]
MATQFTPIQVAPGGVEVEFAERGTGEAILLVHAGVFGAWFAPLATDPSLDGFRVIEMHRAGYTGGAAPTGPVSMSELARHCAALLEELGVDGAHYCGHSSSAVIGLQLALDRPDLVRSLVLLEPAASAFLPPADVEAFGQHVVRPAISVAAAGDVPTGFDIFMTAVGGKDYRRGLDTALGEESYPRMIRDAQFFFGGELPAVRAWRLTDEDARRIQQPVLLVQGEGSPPRFHDACAILAGQLPNARIVTVPGVSHLLPLEDPAGFGRVIAEFVRHG